MVAYSSNCLIHQSEFCSTSSCRIEPIGTLIAGTLSSPPSLTLSHFPQPLPLCLLCRLTFNNSDVYQVVSLLLKTRPVIHVGWHLSLSIKLVSMTWKIIAVYLKGFLKYRWTTFFWEYFLFCFKNIDVSVLFKLWKWWHHDLGLQLKW